MNYPPNVTQNQLDQAIFEDGVWELACHLFTTDNPTSDQLHFAVDYGENLAIENLYEE